MPIERETIITDRSGPGAGAIIGGILAVLVAVLLVFWLMNGGLSVNNSGTGGTIDVDVPTVTVTPDGQ